MILCHIILFYMDDVGFADCQRFTQHLALCTVAVISRHQTVRQRIPPEAGLTKESRCLDAPRPGIVDVHRPVPIRHSSYDFLEFLN